MRGTDVTIAKRSVHTEAIRPAAQAAEAAPNESIYSQ
jgi:hypothetical protein